MIPCVRVKEGVQFTKIAPGGFRILSKLEFVAQALNTDIWITSACDGVHSGPTDSHPAGRAYDIDVEPHNTTKLQLIVKTLMDSLGNAIEGSGGWVTDYFFGWVEAAGTPNEHGHVQVRKGIAYPPAPIQPVELNLQGDA